jgi:hypothetical protein
MLKAMNKVNDSMQHTIQHTLTLYMVHKVDDSVQHTPYSILSRFTWCTRWMIACSIHHTAYTHTLHGAHGG